MVYVSVWCVCTSVLERMPVCHACIPELLTQGQEDTGCPALSLTALFPWKKASH